MRRLHRDPSLSRGRGSLQSAVVVSALCATMMALGCKSPSAEKKATLEGVGGAANKNQGGSAPSYPARPTTPPPSFRLFHQSDNTLTLVTTETATSDQIAAIIYQLRDAANSHTFDALHLPQSLIDKRDPIIWFHIYRGAKCASEKYTTTKLPCGASYHAAGDFTLGSFKDPNHTDGELLADENHPTALWNSNSK